MPKVSGKVIKSGIKDGRLLCVIQLNRSLPKLNEMVSCQWGTQRSNKNNRLLWAFYKWLMNDCELKDEYYSAEELHETLKVALLSEPYTTKTGKTITKVGSTTDLDDKEFNEFRDKVGALLAEFHGIDTSEFWREYETNHQVA